jgi:hypothetical protein
MQTRNAVTIGYLSVWLLCAANAKAQPRDAGDATAEQGPEIPAEPGAVDATTPAATDDAIPAEPTVLLPEVPQGADALTQPTGPVPTSAAPADSTGFSSVPPPPSGYPATYVPQFAVQRVMPPPNPMISRWPTGRRERRGNTGLAIGGVAALAAGYGLALMVVVLDANAPRSDDLEVMAIPLAGPAIMLGKDIDTLHNVVAVTDLLIQAAGAVMIGAALATPREVFVPDNGGRPITIEPELRADAAGARVRGRF